MGENKVYVMHCHYCPKEFRSLSKKQVQANHAMHEMFCRNKVKKRKKQDGTKEE